MDKMEGIGFILFALIFIVVGVVFIFVVPPHIKGKNSQGKQNVLARIVDLRTSQDIQNNSMYAPVYEYFFNGKMYRAESKLYTSKKTIMGSEVKLLIDPYNPYNIVDSRSLLMALIFRIAGIVCFIPAVTAILIWLNL